MEQPRTQELAEALLAAPGWARVGLTAPRERLRNAAALELALQVQSVMNGIEPTDPRQRSLPF